jgi:hypothetical protein
MSKATIEGLGGMHGMLAAHFTDVLKNGERATRVDKETGEVIEYRTAPTAATLNQIRQFLKDNQIEADRTKNKPLIDLASQLPTYEPDEYDTQPGAAH